MCFYKTELGKLYHSDCRKMDDFVKDDSVDLVVTSPPYNVGIPYSNWKDSLLYPDYFNFIQETFSVIYSKLKSDGRIAVNIPYSTSDSTRYGVFFLGRFWNVLDEIGYRFKTIIHLNEGDSSNRSSNTAWGSWLSPSAPFIFNPEELILICHKNQWEKNEKGKSYFNDSNKNEFMDLVKGKWDYKPQTKQLTQANFSKSIPENCLKILSYENDIVLDPFMGSGTTAIVCEEMKRQWLGFEISKQYCQVTKNRIKDHTSHNYFFDKTA